MGLIGRGLLTDGKPAKGLFSERAQRLLEANYLLGASGKAPLWLETVEYGHLLTDAVRKSTFLAEDPTKRFAGRTVANASRRATGTRQL
jgi:hypothetical protein